MGSRRTTTRSTSWNGRSTNGDVNNGGSRPGSRSYLSNVRPENRSTLCSVMAQLTEETQPSFQITLKSKAVSENCNVKFSCVVTGYPAPQVNWYKDDMQLDRYCGLPKYEIFRNGQSHSLHIYNCTVEDAAIYQASAINSKGIVSCSGVLEVGEMNEFKIHQRYFAKIKQKAELKRREVEGKEGKENQEPLRTISPDRTLRKRRSTMEAFLSTPSSTEDESNEEVNQAVAVNPEDRLQEATVEEVGEKPITNGQVVNENGNNSSTYIYDSAQKIFTAHQPKTPFVKKKIKISNSSKVAKADTLGEKVSEERRAKDEASASAALARIDPTLSKRNLEEVMKVEKADSLTHLDADSRNVREQCQKSLTEKAMLVEERPSKDKNECIVPSQGAVPVSPAALTSTGDSVSGNRGKQATMWEREVERAGESLQMQRQSPYLSPNNTSTQSSGLSIPLSILNENTIKTEEATAMDTDERSDTSTGGPLAQRDLQSVDALCEIRTALPPSEHAGDQLSDKETSPCQENVSEPLPAPLREVKQAHTTMNRNDAPVNPEPPHDPCTMDTHQPQKSPSKSETTTDDIQTPSLHFGPQAAIDKMTQGTRDHSRGSNQSPVVLFTDLQKSPLESPSAAENSPGCNISPPTIPQSQVDTAIETVEGTEIQVDKEVEGNKVAELLVEAENEKVVEMETESIALSMAEQTKTENTKDVVDTDIITVEASCKEKNKTMSKVQRRSESHNLKSNEFETPIPHLTNKPENRNTSVQNVEFNEISKPVSKVISIAEIMRSQIKALDFLTSSNSAPTLQEPTTATKACQELRDDNRKCKLEVKTPKPGKKSEAIIDNIATHTTVTPMKVGQTEQTQSTNSSPAKALQKALNEDTTGPQVSTKKYNKAAMDIDQETGPSSLVPPYCPVVSLTENENITSDRSLLSTLKAEMTNRPPSTSNLSGTVSHGSGIPIQVSGQEHAQDEPVPGKGVDMIQKITSEIKLNSKSERRITEKKSTTKLEQYQMEEHNTSSLQKNPTPSVFGQDTQDRQLLQQDSSMVEEFSRTDSLTNSTLETSPLPIPSATPQELASGARRKILTPKAKTKETTEATSPIDNSAQKKELSTSPVTPLASPSLSRRSNLLQPAGEPTSLVERRSPLLSRRKTVSETQSPNQQPAEVNTLKTEVKPTEKDKHDPFKAPQVIRKIRGETFADASGHFKLWCQFFNVLSDSTIKWYKNEEEIVQIRRNAGDETQVNLAIVQASSRDSGVYRCSITNEYGTDSTDTLLSTEILAGMSLRDDLGVGEEIEMTPLIFSKGVADTGIWANKLFGRIMMQESRIGDGCSHKVWRAKVIYGLEPVFESGNTCIIKVRNPIAYGGKEESCIMERNLDITKQECKIQNLAREYCKIFSAEARVIENFGPSLEVLPVYLIYRPANTVPYATVEADLTGVYQKYSVLHHTGRLDVRNSTVVEQKCCALQHWIYQWTNGNLLLTRLEGVDTKITNVGISVKSTGHQALSVEGNPKVFEQFVSQHQCNYFCGLLGLRSLKVMDSLLTPAKPKGSKSPLLQRKMTAGSSSPQTGRKAAGSPRLPRKAEQEGRKTPTKQKVADAPKVIKMA